MIALWKQKAHSIGAPRPGFVPPLLYSLAHRAGAYLDIATGTGHVALAAARRSAKATGIDYVPELLDIARLRAQAEELDIEFVQSDAEDLPWWRVVNAAGRLVPGHERTQAALLRAERVRVRNGHVATAPEGRFRR